MYRSSVAPAGGVVSAGYVFEMYAENWSPRAVSIGFNAPLDTQSLTWFGSVGPGAMSGRSVPAAMPLAIWLVESRLVVRWTLMPVDVSNGLRTSWNAFSSAPPQAVQTVTSVEDAELPLLPPLLPPPQAASTNSAPRPSASTRELRLAKTSGMCCSPPKIPTLAGAGTPSCCLLPGRDRGESAPASRFTPATRVSRRTFA